MAKQQPRRQAPPTNPPPQALDLRQRLLADLAVLKIDLTAAALDEVLAQAERQGWPALAFACRLLGEAAHRRRERSLERRVREAGFRRGYTLEIFNWEFNTATIHREQIEVTNLQDRGDPLSL